MTQAKQKRTATKVSRLRRRNGSAREIDEEVIRHAHDEGEWDAPVHVSRLQKAIELPGDLAQRAAFLARLHHEQNLQSWVERVLRERVEIEERAFSQARRDLA